MTIDKIKAKAAQAGSHFFDRGAMRFFNSRILPTTHGDLFVTSERYRDEPRRYTVRRVTTDGNIVTVGEFQQYATAREAHDACMRLIIGGPENE